MSASATALRRVERLHLVAPDATLRHRALRLLEDAFRTATLPDDASRVVVVRRLALPHFSAEISPQALSLELERRVAALARHLVHAGDGGANHAPAVWFRDALEAHTLLALRVAARAPAREWFWQLALPRLFAGASREPALRAITLSLAALDEAPAALPAYVAALAARGHLRALIECLAESDGASLIRSARAERDANPLDRPGEFDVEVTAPTSHPAMLEASIPRGERARARWVAAMLGRAGYALDAIAMHLGVERPAHSPSPSRAPKRKAATATPASQLAADDEAAAPPNSTASLERERATTRAAREANGRAAEPLAPERRAKRRSTLAPAPESRPAEEGALAPLDPQAWPEGVPTAAGGLVFLLVVLERLGFAAWSAALPDERARGIAAEVLALALARLCVDRDDPAHALVAALAPHADAAHRLEMRDAAALWLAASRGWLKRRARLHLGALVIRPARLRESTTHLDVYFELRDLDVRVRRAGLDLDPGWLPWIARVVSFHYERGVHPR